MGFSTDPPFIPAPQQHQSVLLGISHSWLAVLVHVTRRFSRHSKLLQYSTKRRDTLTPDQLSCDELYSHRLSSHGLGRGLGGVRKHNEGQVRQCGNQ